MRFAALAFLLLIAGCGCVSIPTHSDLRATALRLEFGKSAICSGTAIAPDTLITAQHCLRLGGPLRTVNGQAVKVVGIGKDKGDTLTIRVSGIAFKHWAHFGPPLQQGDEVQWFGNPAREPDVYRRGYVARVTDAEVLIDAQAFGGDSGAGVLDAQGRLIGVLTGMTGWRDGNGMAFTLIVMYPIRT
jgi:hypothetical protein